MSSSSESHGTHDLNVPTATEPQGELANSMVKFLLEAGIYFTNRPVGGEDMAHWSNVINAENCAKSAALIQSQAAEIERLTVGFDRLAGAQNAIVHKITARAETAEADLARAREHVETLSELLKIIREHWVDYDHVFSIAVHEADQWVARAALPNTTVEGREDE